MAKKVYLIIKKEFCEECDTYHNENMCTFTNENKANDYINHLEFCNIIDTEIHNNATKEFEKLLDLFDTDIDSMKAYLDNSSPYMIDREVFQKGRGKIFQEIHAKYARLVKLEDFEYYINETNSTEFFIEELPLNPKI